MELIIGDQDFGSQFAQKMNAELNCDDLSDIKSNLYNARSKWEDIGLSLNIDLETLTCVKSLNRERHDDCLQEMLAHRLQATPSLTWRMLCECLRCPTVARNNVAVEIEDWIKGKVKKATRFPDDRMESTRKRKRPLLSDEDLTLTGQGVECDEQNIGERKKRAISSDVLKRTFPSIHISKLSKSEIEKLIRELFFQSSDLSCKFHNLFSGLCLSLEQRSIPVKRLVICLIGLEAYPPVYKKSSQLLFKDQHSKLFAAVDLTEVWLIIKLYCSYFNYYIIEHITGQLGTDEDKQRMLSYKNAFSQYAERRVYECPAEFGSFNDDDCTIIVKLDKSYDDCTADQLIILKNKLCDIFNISHNGVLRLCAVEQGCYELTFQAPLFIQESIFPLSPEQETALNELKIVWLLCGNYEFSASKLNQESHENYSSDDERDDDHPDIKVMHVDNRHADDLSKAMERAHAVMQPAEKFNDYVPSDSGIGYDAETKSFFTEDSTGKPSENEQPLTDDYKSDSLINSNCLVSAAYNGELLKVRYCLEVLHCDPLQHDSNDKTALTAAADGGKLNVLNYIRGYVEDEKQNSIVSPLSVTVLHIAALNGNLQMVKFLVEEAMVDPLPVDIQKKTPLHNACRNGNIEVVKYLIDQAIKQHYLPLRLLDKTKMETTILHFAAVSGNCQLVAHLVSDLKVDPNALGQFGATALLIAAQEGHLNVVQYLTSLRNCSISIKTHNAGQNALHIASRKGHLSIIKFFVSDKKLDPNIRDFAGYTPLHLAAQGGSIAIVRFFIEDCKCDPLCVSKKRRTPLHMAAMEGNLEVVDYFVNKMKVEPLLKAISQVSPLHLAVQTGKTKVVEYYLDSLGCVLNSPDRLGEKLLFKAVNHGHLPVVEQLVLRQVWTEKHTGFRQTQLLITAVQRGHLHILEYLAIECHWECSNIFHEKISLLNFAIASGHLNVVRFLISKTDNSIWYRPEKVVLPLHLACYSGHKHIVEFLIEEHGADLTQIDRQGMSPLHYAACSGQCDVVRCLIEYKADLYSGLKGVGTPLHCAVSTGKLNVVQYFVNELNVSPNVSDYIGFIPLHCACSNGDTKIIQFFIENKDCEISSRNIDKNPPLMLAVHNGHLKAVDLMVKTKRCDLLMKDHNDNNMLHVAAQNGHLDIVKYIISEQLIDLNVKGYVGKTALSAACYSGHEDVVKYLTIDCKCSLQSDDGDVTPLHEAAVAGHLNLVKFLIYELHCDPYCVDNSGATLLHSAVTCEQTEVAKFFVKDLRFDPNILDKQGHTPIISYLVHSSKHNVNAVKYFINKLKCDPTIIMGGGNSILHFAAQAGNVEVFKVITSSLGKDSRLVSATNQDNLSPLHFACYGGQLEIVKFLMLGCKCSIQPASDGMTLLHGAAAAGQINVIEFLINDLHWDHLSVDKYGHTPLHVAIARGRVELSRYFVKDLNCDPNILDYTGSTPLMSYIHNPSSVLSTVKCFVKELKCDPTIRGIFGKSALHIAAQVDNLEVFKFLASAFLDVNVDVLASDDDQITSLHEAARAGHLRIVKFLTNNMNCNPLCSDKSGATPLHFAMKNGHLKVCEFFVKELKCDPNVQDSNGETPLWYVLKAFELDHTKLKYLIHELKCNPAIPRKDGSNVLHLVAQNGNFEALKFLFSASQMKIFLCSDVYVTLLHIACECSHLNIIEFLSANLGRRTISEVVDQNRFSPLHYAVKGGHLDAVKMLVLDKSHNPYCFDLTGKTPFHLATQLGHLDIVQWFFSGLSLDPNICTKNVFGFTPLHIACFSGDEKVVRYFIDLPTCDKFIGSQAKGMTGLHLAAQRGHSRILKLLTAIPNCDLLCKSFDGFTALQLAVDLGHFECTVMLASALKVQGKQLQNVGMVSQTGRTILHLACYQKNVKIVKYLLNEIDEDFVRITDKLNETPLFSAVHANNTEVFDYLINKNPQSVHSQDIHGDTVLHTAAFEGHSNIAETIILDHAVDPLLQNYVGTTALHLACANGNKPLVTFLNSFDRVLDIRGINRHTPLHTAASEGHLHIIKILVAHEQFGHDHFFCLDGEGSIPCYLAAYQGFIHIVNFIVEYCLKNQPFAIASHMEKIQMFLDIAKKEGRICTQELLAHRAAEKRYVSALDYFFKEESYNPNCRDSLRRTPLHYAAMTYKNERCLQFLLDSGSNLMAEDVFHNQPIHYAVALGHIVNARHLLPKYEKLSPSRTRGVLGMSLLDIARAGGHSNIYQELLYSDSN